MKQSIITYLTNVAKANCGKLRKIDKQDNPMEEAIKLVNEVVELSYKAYHTDETKKYRETLLLRSMFLTALDFIVMPTAYGVFTDLLLGNLPTCFTQLRLIVETLAKALATDYATEFKGISIFNAEELERYLEQHKISISKFFDKYFSEIVGEDVASETLKLWSKLSRDWAHFRGIVKKLRERTAKGTMLPSYSVAIPIEYDEEDEDDLKELGKRIKETRELLHTFFEKWIELLRKINKT